METNYLDMLDEVRSYYGSGLDQWVSIDQYDVTDQNWEYLEYVYTLRGVNYGKYIIS